MQGIHEFIVEVKEPLKNKEELGKIEIDIDPTFDQTRHSNRIGKVIATPLAMETDICVGDEVVIVHTVLMSQIYYGQHTDSVHLIDKEKGYYRLENNLIIMYRKNKNTPWICNDIFVMVSAIKAEKEDYCVGSLQLPDNYYNTDVECNSHGFLKQYGIVYLLNSELASQGVKVGDKVFFESYGNYEFRMNKEVYYCMDNRDVLAVIPED